MATRKLEVMSEFLRVLNPVVRAEVGRRCDAMQREFEYLQNREDENLIYALKKGWSEEKFRVLFLLNSIYQMCIGPLQSSARVSAGLGGEIPILHGAEVFDQSRSGAVSEMVADFFSMSVDLGFHRDWMAKNTCGDLVYWIARREREREAI